MARRAEEIQGYTNRNEWKNFFSAIKTVNRSPTKGIPPLLDADRNTLLTEKIQILQQRVKHFGRVLNRSSTIPCAAIARLSPLQNNVNLDLPPSLREKIKAVKQLSRGKAAGSEAIPAKIYKRAGPQLMDHLTALVQEMWRQGGLAGLQGRQSHAPLQAERNPPALRQPPRHLLAEHRLEYLRSLSPRPPEPPSGTKSPAGKLVRPPSS
nr:unnamed protein product [Spirometra erinaceieuropaei]